MRVALLHNLRPPEGGEAFEEFDSPETIAAIARALEGIDGVHVTPVEFHRNTDVSGFDLVFNIAEGQGGRSREAHAAAVCELQGVPYTGSDPLTLAVTLDKVIAKRIVSPDVPVAGADRYPVVVKPRNEGSSIGIRDHSIAYSEQEASKLAADIKGEVLIESYLPGREVTVGILGNGAGARVVGMMEIAPNCEAKPFLYSIDVKRDWRNRVRYKQIYDPEIASLALKAYELLGCRDVSRIDFRCDEAGRPHFLECNPLPGLDPLNSDLVLMTTDYEKLVQSILIEAIQRTQ